MGIEGHLSIGLRTACGCVDQVSIDSSRPLYAARVFHGKRVSEALKMLPMLFSVCGAAQACAGVRACEQALGVRAVACIERLRDCLVGMETMREHLWRILLDWPIFLEQMPAKNGMTGMLALQCDHRLALTVGQDPFQLCVTDRFPASRPSRDFVREASLILERRVFGMSPAHWLDIDSSKALEKWAASATTVAARLLRHVMQMQWSEVGCCEIAPLPFMDEGHVQQMLEDDDFIRRPQWFGDCRETTCLTRVDSPLLQHLRSRYGNGLLVRLVARLTELAQLSGDLIPVTMAAEEDRPVSAHNPGLGQAAAARGQLLHRVRVENDCIVSYQILAPTEWNFHPQGVLAKSLATLQGDVAQMQQQARLLINAIDPCVGYELSID